MTTESRTSHDVVEDWIFFGAIPLHFVLFVALLVSLPFAHEKRTSSRDGFLGSEPIWSTGGIIRFER